MFGFIEDAPVERNAPGGRRIEISKTETGASEDDANPEIGVPGSHEKRSILLPLDVPSLFLPTRYSIPIALAVR